MSNQHYWFLLYTQPQQTDQHRYRRTPMWQSYSNGLLIAAGLIIALGAQNAFVLAQSLRREHHLPVALLCVVCDALLVTAGVFGLAAVLAQSPILLGVARWGGAAFLLWYGTQALLRASRPQALNELTQTGPRSRRAVLLAALAVTLLNPHVYLDTVLLIGATKHLALYRSGRGLDDVQHCLAAAEQPRHALKRPCCNTPRWFSTQLPRV